MRHTYKNKVDSSRNDKQSGWTTLLQQKAPLIRPNIIFLSYPMRLLFIDQRVIISLQRLSLGMHNHTHSSTLVSLFLPLVLYLYMT